jgi:hypothetical protein
MGRFFSWKYIASLGGLAFNKVRGIFGAGNPNALSTADKMVLHSEAGQDLVKGLGTAKAAQLLKEIDNAKKPTPFQRMWKPVAGIAGLGLVADAGAGGRDSLVGKWFENVADGAKKIDSITDTNALFARWGNFLNNIYKFFLNFGAILRGEAQLGDIFSEKGKEASNSGSPLVNAAKAVGNNPGTAAVVAAPIAAVSAASKVVTGSWNPLSFFGNGPHDGGSGGSTSDGNGGGDAPRGGNGDGSTTVKSTHVSDTEFEAAKRNGNGDLFDKSGKNVGIEAAEDAATHGAAGAKRTFLSKMFRGAASFKGNALVTGGLALGAGGYSLLSGASNAEAAEAAADTLGYGETVHNLREGNHTEAVHSATTATTSLAGGVAGAGLGMAWGAAAGSVVPVAGTFVGGIVGGIAGGLAGSGAGSIIGEAAYTAGSYIAGGLSSVFNSKANPAAAPEFAAAPTIHRDTGLTFGF